MSITLRDLIRMVRACKTAAEERAVISKECALIRTAIREESEIYRSRNVAKLMYIHMLGYPTAFGQMETLKLISAPSFSDKRVGHLALTLLLTENTEVLTLVTNSLKVDLSNSNQYIQALSLISIGNLATSDMARDLASDVEKILKGMSSYLKKKAALATIRLIKKEPELIEHLSERIITLLKDRTHGVLITTIQLIIEVISVEPETKNDFKTIVPGLVRLLRNFMSIGHSPEYDVHGITDPFMQVEIIKLLGILGANDEETSDQMNDVLAQVANSTETNKVAGNAILYECVKTVMKIKSDGSLRNLAVNILGQFLLNRDNNIRYVALNSLMNVVGEDANSVQKHRGTILECLKDVDISIRQRALDLCYLLVDLNTVSQITTELLNYLVVAPVEHKSELVSRIMGIVERFAPSKKWRIDTMITMLSIAGNHCDEGTPRIAIIFIAQAEGLQGYATHKLYKCLHEDTSQSALNIVAVWCIGEYGELLFQSCPSINDSSTGPSEAFNALNTNEVVQSLSSVLHIHNADVNTKSCVLNALLKLCVRTVGDNSIKTMILDAMIPISKSLSVELQQRATEYIQLLGSQWDALRPELLSRMPVLDEATMRSRRAEWYTDRNSSNSGDNTPSSASTPTGIDASNDVMNLLGSPTTMGSSNSGANNINLIGGNTTPSGGVGVGGLLDLDDIFGVSGNSSSTITPTPSNDLSSMLGSVSSSNTNGNSNVVDMLSTLSSPPTTSTGIPTESAPGANFLSPNLLNMSSPVSTTTSTNANITSTMPNLNNLSMSTPSDNSNIVIGVPSIVGFEKNGLKVTIEYSKPDTSNNSKSELMCKFANSAGASMTNLVFQAAVPKYLKLEMHPPSSTTIPPASDGAVTQKILLNNSQQGEKKIMLKLKISYTLNGNKVEEMAQVANFPPTF